MIHRRASLICQWGFATGAAVLFSAVPLLAADKLPKDGAWARYYVLHKGADGTERTNHTTIRFVGTVIEKGEKHRWVEIGESLERDAAGGKKETKHYATKFLISEKALRTASNPIQHLVRVWQGEVGKSAEKFEASQGNGEIFDAYYGQPLLFLAGASKAAKPTKHKRSIDYQDGQLSIDTGRCGTYVTDFHPENPKVLLLTWRRTYEFWTHKSVPLGMASLKYRVVQTATNDKGKVRVLRTETGEYTVEAWGTDAKSALPNAK